MKKVFMILCLTLCALLAFTACAGKSGAGDPKCSMSMSELAEDIMGKVEFAMTMSVDMTNEDERAYLAESTGLDPAWMADSSINTNMIVSADNLFLAEGNTMEDAEKIAEAFEKQKQNVIQSFEQYLPDPLEMAKNGQVVTKGRYVMLVISSDNDTVIAAFEAAIQ